MKGIKFYNSQNNNIFIKNKNTNFISFLNFGLMKKNPINSTIIFKKFNMQWLLNFNMQWFLNFNIQWLLSFNMQWIKINQNNSIQW